MKKLFFIFSLLLLSPSVFAGVENFQCRVGLVNPEKIYDSKNVDINLNLQVADFPDVITGGHTKLELASYKVDVAIYHTEDSSSAARNTYSFQVRAFDHNKKMLVELRSKMLESSIQNGIPSLDAMAAGISLSLSCQK